MEHGREVQKRWESAFWVQVRAQVVGTLIATGILALIGGVIAIAGNLSIGEFLAILAGIVFAAIVVSLVVAYVNTRRSMDVLATWASALTSEHDKLRAEVRWLRLRDVSATAEARGWQVYTDHGGELIFESPDKPPDRVPITALDPDPQAVADELHNAAPQHFPDDWRQPDVYELARDAEQQGRRLYGVYATVDTLEKTLPMRLARAALGNLAAEAKGLGWETRWGTDEVRFLRKNSTATVRYDEEIDFSKLRKALGLQTFFTR